jgi:hypothetical protein
MFNITHREIFNAMVGCLSFKLLTNGSKNGKWALSFSSYIVEGGIPKV